MCASYPHKIHDCVCNLLLGKCITIHNEYMDASSYISGRCVFPIRTRFMIVFVIGYWITKMASHQITRHQMSLCDISEHYMVTAQRKKVWRIYIYTKFLGQIQVTYLDECYISGRWSLHIWTSVTYLDDGAYIFGRVLHIWTMVVTYLDECYISWRRSSGFYNNMRRHII